MAIGPGAIKTPILDEDSDEQGLKTCQKSLSFLSDRAWGLAPQAMLLGSLLERCYPGESHCLGRTQTWSLVASQGHVAGRRDKGGLGEAERSVGRAGGRGRLSRDGAGGLGIQVSQQRVVSGGWISAKTVPSRAEPRSY